MYEPHSGRELVQIDTGGQDSCSKAASNDDRQPSAAQSLSRKISALLGRGGALLFIILLSKTGLEIIWQ